MRLFLILAATFTLSACSEGMMDRDAVSERIIIDHSQYIGKTYWMD